MPLVICVCILLELADVPEESNARHSEGKENQIKAKWTRKKLTAQAMDQRNFSARCTHQRNHPINLVLDIPACQEELLENEGGSPFRTILKSTRNEDRLNIASQISATRHWISVLGSCLRADESGHSQSSTSLSDTSSWIDCAPVPEKEKKKVTQTSTRKDKS